MASVIVVRGCVVTSEVLKVELFTPVEDGRLFEPWKLESDSGFDVGLAECNGIAGSDSGKFFEIGCVVIFVDCEEGITNVVGLSFVTLSS